MRRLRIKPHLFVLVVGALVMVGAFFSGVFPRITKWHDDAPVAREVFVNIPDPLYWAFYTTVPVMLFMVAYLVSLRVPELRARRPRRPAHDEAEPAQAHQGVPQGRLDADAAARPRRRDHALLHLLRLHLPVHHHGDPRDRPPVARVDEVPARPYVPGVRARPATSRASSSSSASGGRSAAATSSGPTASASRPSPRTPRSSSRSRSSGSAATSPKPRASHSKAGRTSSSGRSSATRSRHSSTRGRRARSATRTGGCGCCTSPRSSRSS